MRVIAALTTLVFLAACGADGDPITPSANLGLRITPNGISPTVGVGANVGGVNVGVSL